jgi:hypothetical protein
MADAPITNMGEQSRQGKVDKQRTAQPHNEVEIAQGKIKAIDKIKKMIKATEGPPINQPIMGDRWIALAHPIHDLIDRFGTVRLGMEVLVIMQGRSTASPRGWAFIIGEEGEYGPSGDFVPNDIGLGFHNILMEKI